MIQFDSTLTATFITYAVTGLIVVGAVLLDVFKKKSMNRVKIERGAKKLRRTTAAEVEANPRAHSAKLRYAIKSDKETGQ